MVVAAVTLRTLTVRLCDDPVVVRAAERVDRDAVLRNGRLPRVARRRERRRAARAEDTAVEAELEGEWGGRARCAAAAAAARKGREGRGGQGRHRRVAPRVLEQVCEGRRRQRRGSGLREVPEGPAASAEAREMARGV